MPEKNIQAQRQPRLPAAIGIGAAFSAVWIGFGAVLLWFAPEVKLLLPDFCLPPVFLLSAYAIAAVSCGAAAILLLRRAANRNTLGMLAAHAVFSLLSVASLFFAGIPALAFVSAAPALGLCAAGVRRARRASTAAAICLLPPLFLSGYAIALIYAIAMINP